MLTVCCLWDPKHHDSDTCIVTMKNMVARNLSVDHKFVCVTTEDVETHTDRVVLGSTLGGKWTRYQIFSPDVLGTIGDDVIYIDVNSVIVGSLDPLASVRHSISFHKDKTMTASGRHRPSLSVVRWTENPASIWSHLEANAHKYDMTGDEKAAALDAAGPNLVFMNDSLPEHYILDWTLDGISLFRDQDSFVRLYPSTAIITFAGHKCIKSVVEWRRWLLNYWY